MRLAVLLAVGCGAGCTNLSYRPPADVPPSAALTAGPRVTLADARHRWERRPFDDGYGLADLDALRPDPWAAVRREAEAAVGPAGGPTATVTVRAFRVVLADLDQLQAEQDELKRRTDGDESSVVAAVFGALVRPLLVEVICGKRYPAEVRNQAPGATCTLTADVTLAWPDGRTRTAFVSAVRNADTPAAGGRKYWGDDMNRAVADAAVDFGRQLRDLVQAGPGG